jgi:sugar O-acyltransferase (sialic acid O-acetyltransferase NeuD family)
MRKQIVILGSGGNCIDILDTILAINATGGQQQFDCLGFLDDDPQKHGDSIGGFTVLGGLSEAGSIPDAVFVNGISTPNIYREKADLIARTGIPDSRFQTLVHPSTMISNFATIGIGSVFLQNCVVNANVKIGKHVIVLPLSVVSHDTQIGDFTTVTGGVCLSGSIEVGRACYLGSNCSIRGRLKVGDYALIGMSSVIISNVEPYSVMVGNPAYKLRDVREG